MTTQRSTRAVGENTYVVTYPHPVSQAGVEQLQRVWKQVMGDARLVVLDSGAKITRLSELESTPIYDALVAEFEVAS